jgi:hypothetical protein
MKQARNSFGKPYDCKKEWPDDCFVQCGDTGIVFGRSGSLENVMTADNVLGALSEEIVDEKTYTTAFFEAFPKEPNTFIRGEGKNVEEAEENAWNDFQKFSLCDKHEFEKRGYKNGAGFCKHCGMFASDAFEPENKCIICGKPTYYTNDIDDNWYCEEHDNLMPEDKKPEWKKRHERLKKYMEEKKNKNDAKEHTE